MKEIKLRVTTDRADLERKIRQADAFLDDGHRVVVSIQMRGRENAHPEKALDVLRFFGCSVFAGVWERDPVVDGQRATLVLRPAKRSVR